MEEWCRGVDSLQECTRDCPSHVVKISRGMCGGGYLGYPGPRWTGIIDLAYFRVQADGGEFFSFFPLFFPSTGPSDLEAAF